MMKKKKKKKKSKKQRSVFFSPCPFFLFLSSPSFCGVLSHACSVSFILLKENPT